MEEISDAIPTSAESTKYAETSKPRRGLFSRFRRRKAEISSKDPVETNYDETEEGTERTVSEAETTDFMEVVPVKGDDNLVAVETATTFGDAPENDSVASSPSSLVSSCSVNSFFTAATDESLGPSYESKPENYLHKCLRLLSSNDLDLNRLGLQKLNSLVSGRLIMDNFRSEEIAASILVLGGALGSVEELLRFVFVTMICDNPQNHSDRTSPTIRESLSKEEEAIEEWVLRYDPSTCDVCDKGDDEDDVEENDSHCDSDCESELDNRNEELDYSTHHSRHASCDDNLEDLSTPKSQGKAGGALHNHALKILANALGEVYAEDPTVLRDIPLDCSLWKSIIISLVQNIENNHSAKATLYSMKILRFLYFVQPGMILPLLKYSLFANLVELKDYGEEHGLPMISSEAEKLLMHARVQPRARRRNTASQGGNWEDKGRYVDF